MIYSSTISGFRSIDVNYEAMMTKRFKSSKYFGKYEEEEQESHLNIQKYIPAIPFLCEYWQMERKSMSEKVFNSLLCACACVYVCVCV